MLFPLPDDAAPIIEEAKLEVLLSHPAVQGYLSAVQTEAPGLDLTVDRCVAMGFLAVREARAGRLDEYRSIAGRTFDLDEHDTLVAAGLAFLLPLILAGEAANPRRATRKDIR